MGRTAIDPFENLNGSKSGTMLEYFEFRWNQKPTIINEMFFNGIFNF